jgi:hypothetical protein
MVGREASTVPYHSSGCVCRAGRTRRAPAVDRPGRHSAGRDQRTDARARRRDARFDDGGDGGLFCGILARYVADAAVRRPELARRATRLVLASAAAAWQGRVEVTDGPVFAPTGASQPARPVPGFPSPTCRSSCRRGCSWRPLPQQPAPASLPPSRTATRRDATRTTSDTGHPTPSTASPSCRSSFPVLEE